MELFAFLQRAEQGLPGIGPLGDFRDARDEFAEHVIALAALQVQFDRGGGDQVADEDSFWLRRCHRAGIVRPARGPGEEK